MTSDQNCLLTGINELQQLIDDLALIIVPNLGDFEIVWETAHRVCDRYYRADAA